MRLFGCRACEDEGGGEKARVYTRNEHAPGLLSDLLLQYTTQVLHATPRCRTLNTIKI